MKKKHVASFTRISKRFLWYRPSCLELNFQKQTCWSVHAICRARLRLDRHSGHLGSPQIAGEERSSSSNPQRRTRRPVFQWHHTCSNHRQHSIATVQLLNITKNGRNHKCSSTGKISKEQQLHFDWLKVETQFCCCWFLGRRVWLFCLLLSQRLPTYFALLISESQTSTHVTTKNVYVSTRKRQHFRPKFLIKNREVSHRRTHDVFFLLLFWVVFLSVDCFCVTPTGCAQTASLKLSLEVGWSRPPRTLAPMRCWSRAADWRSGRSWALSCALLRSARFSSSFRCSSANFSSWGARLSVSAFFFVSDLNVWQIWSNREPRRKIRWSVNSLQRERYLSEARQSQIRNSRGVLTCFFGLHSLEIYCV